MNCKPGDLAIVVPPSKNAGSIVSVIAPSAKLHGVIGDWFVESLGGPMTGLHVERKRSARYVRGNIPDAWLRPISGLPVTEETRDEVTA